jgi:hypothetical protein
MKAKKIFLICSVRDATREEILRIEEYIKNLEKQGHKVYWPYRDTDQNDPIGKRICTDNATTIIWADEIHIWWTEKSQGSLFDFGMSFMCYILGSKKIVLANPGEVKPTEKKSFNNVLLALHAETMEEKK